MSERLIRNLKKKGWESHDIHRTMKIIEKGKQKKHKLIKALDLMVFWIALILAIIGNIVILFTLIPFLLMLNSWLYYLIICFLGLSFGLLFEILIRDIEHLERKHHLLIGSLLPVITIVNFILITKILNRFLVNYNLNLQIPLFLGIFYTIAFLLPYFIYQMHYRVKYNILK
mgnify:CR=1 FL=1|tara:strand:- start:341 stop:856 length:516 start_codon:yes stop_codon:yes gene_type:complete